MTVLPGDAGFCRPNGASAADLRNVGACWQWPDGLLHLDGAWPLALEGAAVTGRVTLRAGERVWVMLSDQPLLNATSEGAAQRLEDTTAYWRAWAGQCQYAGPYRPAVVRSALALKLLTFEPTGAIVAAVTTSLPEAIGGVRNWDYRCCWLRDATFTVYALGLLGYTEEAHNFMGWFQQVCYAAGGVLQIMYGVRGEQSLPERTLDHLSGYRGSRPVRTGNAAVLQTQLDMYGEVLDSAYLYFHRLGAGERYGEPLADPFWEVLRGLVDQVADHWHEPDRGIWEVRGGPQHFVYSKVMCWVALDRGLRLARERHLPAPVERWQQEADRLRVEILRRGYSEAVGAFTQAFDSSALDASALLLPLVGFINVADPQMASTVAAIQTKLMRDGLVYRYLSDDGLAGDEGAFAICSFWLCDCLSLGGRTSEARALFEAMQRRASPLGLYSEEVDPATGALLGNFPQAFTHIALINSAVNIERAERRLEAPSRAAAPPRE